MQCIEQNIVRINLTNHKVTWEDFEPYSKFIGGMGVGEKILYDEVKPWVTPYDSNNKIIISAGAVSGTIFPGSGRTALVTKSPMTMGIISSNSGGHFAPKMRYGGFDHIILEGRSAKPVYLFLQDGQVEFRDAANILGKGIWESDDYLKKLHGDDIETLLIGPAGENLVRYSCIMIGKHRALGRCGVGAIMGSKNLKAVVVKGTKDVKVYDDKLFYDKVDDIYNRLYTNPIMKNFMHYGTIIGVNNKAKKGGYAYKHFQDLNIPEKMIENFQPESIVGKYRVCQTSCYGCMLGCQPRYTIKEGPYAGLTMEGTQFNSSLDFGSKLAVDDFGFCIKSTAMCNDLGLDIDSTAETIGWLMECCEKKIISPNELDGIEPKFGSQKEALTLIEKIAYRDGVGFILGEGVARASSYFCDDSKYYAMHIKGNDLYEPLRSAIAYGLGSVTCTRGGSHVLGSPLCEAGVIEDKEIAFKKFGVTTYNDPLSYEGKPEMVMYYEIITRMCSCLGLCTFVSDWQEIHMLDKQDLTDILYATTGLDISVEEFCDRMMSLLALEKIFNYLHIGFDRSDDYPPERMIKEKVKSGFAKGQSLDIDKWDELLDKYYKIHGWDIESGIPTEETLRRLGLDFCIDDLNKKESYKGKLNIY